MKKYDPDESITCPKCGKGFTQSAIMNVTFVEKFYVDETLSGQIIEVLSLSCMCGWQTHRRPLDYKGDD